MSGVNVSNVTNMQGMFEYNRKLTELDATNWDTSKVTDMSGMFINTSSLISVYVSDNFSTDSVTST